MSCCPFFRRSSGSQSKPLFANPVSTQLERIIEEANAYIEGKPLPLIGSKREKIARGAGNTATREAEIDTDLTTCKVQLMKALRDTAMALNNTNRLDRKQFNSRLQQWYDKSREIGWLGRQLTTAHQKMSGRFERLFGESAGVFGSPGAIFEQLNSIQTSCHLANNFAFQIEAPINSITLKAQHNQYMADKQKIVNWAEKFTRKITSPSCMDSVCVVM